jgi:predicted nicotinamide N-methyase
VIELGFHVLERWERDPYWCRCWPSALALGRLFTKRPELAQSLRVCEIGAGLGIAGIAAAFAGSISPTSKMPLEEDEFQQ